MSGTSADGAARGSGLPRAVDLGVALVALALAAPAIGLLALLVRATSPGPALFRQTRAGRGGCPFVLLKLRTMRAGAAGAEVTVRGDARITPLGRWLRRFKLDELPQLWNVVRGDLALVGPRPEVPRYVDLDDPLWREALSVRPGLTDAVTLRLHDEEAVLAAAGGDPDLFYRRHLLPWKLRGTVGYQARRSAWSDVRTLALTAIAIFVPRRPSLPTVEEIVAPDSRSSPSR